MASEKDLERLHSGETDLTYSDLTGADLKGIVLRGLDLSHCSITRASFQGSTIESCNFSHASAGRTIFREATILDSNFMRGSFIGADFGNSRIERSAFQHSNFPRSSFVGAVLRGADFREARISGAIFDGAMIDPTTTFEHAHVMRAEADAPHFAMYRFQNGRLLRLRSPAENELVPPLPEDSSNIETRSIVRDHISAESHNSPAIYAAERRPRIEDFLPSRRNYAESLIISLRSTSAQLREEILSRQSRRPNDPETLEAFESYDLLLEHVVEQLDEAASEISTGGTASVEDAKGIFSHVCSRLVDVRARVDSWLETDAASAVLTKKIFLGGGTVALATLLVNVSGSTLLGTTVAVAIVGKEPICEIAAKLLTALKSDKNS